MDVPLATPMHLLLQMFFSSFLSETVAPQKPDLARLRDRLETLMALFCLKFMVESMT